MYPLAQLVFFLAGGVNFSHLETSQKIPVLVIKGNFWGKNG